MDACHKLAQSGSEQLVVGNRDVHLGNVLSARREPWLLIDPKPVAAERAFDVAYLAQDVLPALPRAADLDALLSRLSAQLEVDADRVGQWMLVRQVDNALQRLREDDDWAQRDLHIARLLAQ